MADFNFKVSPHVIVGSDVVNRLASQCMRHGSRALVVVDPALRGGTKLFERLSTLFESGGMGFIGFDEIPPFAGSAVAGEIAELASGAKADVIVGVGGAKTLALARLAAASCATRMDVDDILDRGGTETSIPVALAPTSMADPFVLSSHAILADSRNGRPKFVRFAEEACKLLILDSALTMSLSTKMAATACFQMLLAAIEAYISSKSNFFSDATLEDGIARLFKALGLYQRGDSTVAAADNLATGACMAAMGIAASSVGLGTCVSYSISIRHRISKGGLAPILLPYVLEDAMKSRVEKVARIAELAGEDVGAMKTLEAAQKACEIVRYHLGELKLPSRIKDYDLQLDKMVEIATLARQMEPMNYLPRILSVEDIYDILKQAF